MIKPTIGRIVWYWGFLGQDYPRAAIVTHVWNDTMVNLAVFDAHDSSMYKSSVTLYQGEGSKPNVPFCEWMPYQIGQAKKYEEAIQSSCEQEQP